MRDNIIGILNQLSNNLQEYEHNVNRSDMTPHERVLDIIEHDYLRFCNHDQWLSALQASMSESEAKIWCEYPTFTINEQGLTVEQVKNKLLKHGEKDVALQAESLTKQLVDKDFLYECNGRYVETYLLLIMFNAIQRYNASPLHKACINWWAELADNGNESKKLRAEMPAHRVIAHEGTLTGDSKYGRIPMNLEIPDTRKILEIDKMSEMLARCRRYAVTECICRKGKDLVNIRECDYPLEVCLLFDEDADGGIELGMAREITYEDALEIIRDCRDRGLVQVISNAEHPLSVCNCCECCCICLRTLNRNEGSMAEVSRFVVNAAHHDRCIKCGACVKICPADAINVCDSYIQTFASKCIGCGLCVSKCPKGVLSMLPKPGAPQTIEREHLRRTYL